MIWGGLLPDIYLQRETELFPDSEMGPMRCLWADVNLEGGAPPQCMGPKRTAERPLPTWTAPRSVISDWLSLTHGRVTYPVLLVDLTEVTQKYENVKKWWRGKRIGWRSEVEVEKEKNVRARRSQMC